MVLHLYDSKTRQTREFVPVRPGEVSIYHCGLTVQGPPHIGHIRKEVVFDVLRRWLERAGYQVTIVANVTDIDDKILTKSQELGIPWWALAYANERRLHSAYQTLGCAPPTYEPRATGHIPEMIEMIEELIARGHAYPADNGDVYFDVHSWPDYGELSNQRLDDMQAAEDAPAEGKRDPRDFALWKGHKDVEPRSASWQTPWGRGRPGWHLECSAMAAKYLGDEFDIHGGGLDLRFPHHENELAQSHACGQPFARLWMHNALLNLGGSKMAKSVGNTMLVDHVAARVAPIALRYYLISAHYRSEIDYSEQALTEAATAFERVSNFVHRATEICGDVTLGRLPAEYTAAMDDDLSVPAAVAVIHDYVARGNRLLTGGKSPDLCDLLADVRTMLDVLGLDPLSDTWASSSESSDTQNALASLVEELIDERARARQDREFERADYVRDTLSRAGIDVEDTAAGPRWSIR